MPKQGLKLKLASAVPQIQPKELRNYEDVLQTVRAYRKERPL
jgi:hypothetical protein